MLPVARCHRGAPTGIAALLLFGIAACTAEVTTAAPEVRQSLAASALREMTGRQLYAGIFLARGRVPELIPPLGAKARALHERQALNPARFAEAERILLESLQDVDSTFFDRFAVEIKSGDRVRIARALREGVEIAQQAGQRAAARVATEADVAIGIDPLADGEELLVYQRAAVWTEDLAVDQHLAVTKYLWLTQAVTGPAIDAEEPAAGMAGSSLRIDEAADLVATAFE